MGNSKEGVSRLSNLMIKELKSHKEIIGAFPIISNYELILMKVLILN